MQDSLSSRIIQKIKGWNMKKSLGAVGLLLALSVTGAMAAKVGDNTIGVEFGSMKINSTYNTSLINSSNFSEDKTYESIKFLKYIENGRVGIIFGHENTKNDINANYMGINYDYMFYNNSKFLPFIGGTANYTRRKDKNSSFTETGVSYGAEAGLLYMVTSEVDVEIGARYLMSNVSGNNVDIDDLTQIYFGINYNF
ncbi:opacity family porin [Sulfurimonas sp.]